MKNILLLLLLLFMGSSVYAQIGINTETPHVSAILDIVSVDKGILPPRLNDSDLSSIPTPIPEGLIIYNLTKHCLQFWNGSEWKGTNCPSTFSIKDEETNVSNVKTNTDISSK